MEEMGHLLLCSLEEGGFLNRCVGYSGAKMRQGQICDYFLVKLTEDSLGYVFIAREN